MAGRHRVVLHRCVGGDGAALVGCFLYRDSPYAYPALSPCCRRPLPCHRRRCRHPRRRCRHPRRHHRRHHRCHRRHPPSVIAPSVIAASDDVGAIGAQPLLKRWKLYARNTARASVSWNHQRRALPICFGPVSGGRAKAKRPYLVRRPPQRRRVSLSFRLVMYFNCSTFILDTNARFVFLSESPA